MCQLFQVQTAVDGLRESAVSRTDELRQEMSTMQDFTGTVKGEWKTYVEKTETNYKEDTSAVEIGKSGLDEGLNQW